MARRSGLCRTVCLSLALFQAPPPPPPPQAAQGGRLEALRSQLAETVAKQKTEVDQLKKQHERDHEKYVQRTSKVGAAGECTAWTAPRDA